MGMRLDVGARTMKKKKIEKEINLFFFIQKMAKMKRRRMTRAEITVGYSSKDFEI
jgi:hypothetical protein